MTDIGHNSNAQLKSIVERAVKLAEDKKAIGDDEKDLYAEAKSNGYEVAAIRKIVREELEDAAKRSKRAAVEETVTIYRTQLKLI